MKNFRLWLENLNPEQKEMASASGYEFVDEIRSGGFNVYLLVNDVMFPKGLKYHIGFEKEGSNVFDYEQQMNRQRVLDANGQPVFDEKGQPKKRRKADIVNRPEEEKGNFTNQYNSILPILEKIHKWIDLYGNLVIASTNEILTEKWIKNLKLASKWFDLPLNTTTKEYMRHTLHILTK